MKREAATASVESARRAMGMVMMSGKRATVFAAALAIVATAAQARHAYRYPSNFALVTAALDSAVVSLLQGLPGSVDRVAVVVESTPATAMRANLVRDALAEALMRRGVVVVADRASCATIEAVVGRLEVTVPSTRRAFLVGRRWAKREADVALTALLRDEHGFAVWTADGAATSSDWVPLSALGWCVGAPALGLAPEVGESASARAAEPILIMSSVGAVIYLFFTQ